MANKITYSPMEFVENDPAAVSVTLVGHVFGESDIWRLPWL